MRTEHSPFLSPAQPYNNSIQQEGSFMYEAERRFVETYLRKPRRERLLYELTSPKKRSRGLERFCHTLPSLIDPQHVVLSDSNLSALKEFRDFVKTHDEICVILSPSFLDGRTMRLSEAVALTFADPDASVILGSTFAVASGEAEKGGRVHYLLSAGTLL